MKYETEALKQRLCAALYTKYQGWDMVAINCIAQIQHGSIRQMFDDREWPKGPTKPFNPTPTDALRMASEHEGGVVKFAKSYGFSRGWAEQRLKDATEAEMA